MLFLCKVWAFIKKYWEAFVALLILMLGIVLGTSGKRTRVLEKDKEALQKQNKDFQEGVSKIITDNSIAVSKAEEKRDKSKEKVDAVSKKKAQDLKEDGEKIDNILQDKYNLKKG